MNEYRDKNLQLLASDAAKHYGIPEDLFLRFLQQEGNKPKLPEEYTKTNNLDPNDLFDTIYGSAHLLSTLARSSNDNKQVQDANSPAWRLAVAAYKTQQTGQTKLSTEDGGI